MKTGTTITAIAALSMLAGTAAADVIQSVRGLEANGVVVGSTTRDGEGIHEFNISSLEHVNVQGSEFTRIATVDVGEGDFGVGGVGWDLWADTPNPEYLELVRIAIVNSDGQGVIIAPFHFDDPGRGEGSQGYHASGWIDISDLRYGFPIRDGQITMEFFLTENPIPGAEVSYLDRSTLSVEVVPAPGALALLGMGGLAVTRRRRK